MDSLKPKILLPFSLLSIQARASSNVTSRAPFAVLILGDRKIYTLYTSIKKIPSPANQNEKTLLAGSSKKAKNYKEDRYTKTNCFERYSVS